MAGKFDCTAEVRERISSLDIDKEIYVTGAAGDATEYVRRRCKTAVNEPLRFYACGGDGTLNEVVSGAVGFGNVEVACVPVGSGNDYVKYYGGAEAFSDMRRIVSGKAMPVDVMRVETLVAGEKMGGIHYSINICNFGFDAAVCRTMEQVRRKKIIGGRNAYTTGIVKALFTSRRTRCRITVDSTLMHDGDILLCTLGNGRYVGGSYQCSPLSLNDDGLIEVCLFKPMSIVSFARLIGSYRDGTFMQREDVQDKMTYLRGKTVEIEAPTEIDLCVDGEMLLGSHFRIEELPQALHFIAPTHQN